MEEIVLRLEEIAEDVKKMTICDLIKIKIYTIIKQWKK